MTGRRGRRHMKLLDDLKERREYSHLKEETLDRAMWRARFGRCFGPVEYDSWYMLCVRSIPPYDGLQICPKHVEVD